MTYKELPRNQKAVRSAIWVGLLDEYCPPVYSDGTRMCDLTGGCDNCHYDEELQAKYLADIVKAGLILTDDEELKLKRKEV